MNLSETKRLLEDLSTPEPATFWRETLGTGAVGWLALGVGMTSARPGVVAIAFVVALGAMFRATLLMHELAHLGPTQLPGLRLAWNFLWGVPFMVPSWLFERMHGDHHRPNLYGTRADPQYPPLANFSPRRLVAWALMGPWLPVLLWGRFALLTPLSVVPGVRRFVLARLSSLTLNPGYRARPLLGPEQPFALRTEVLTMLAAWGWVALAVASPRAAGFAGVTLVAHMALQQWQMVLAHRYESEGELMNEDDVHADSYNFVPRSRLLRFLVPAGARLHALHHVAPDVPFHNLEAAHRRLVDWLPADSTYHLATVTTVTAILTTLVASTRDLEPA